MLRHILAVGLDGAIQLGAHAVEFCRHTFFNIAVAVKVVQRTIHTDVLEVILGLDVGVAALALVDLEFERMRTVAADARIVTIYVRELAVVFLVGILIAAFDNGAIQRGARRKVVNVGEGDLVADRIHVGHCRVLDLRINRRFRARP